jgi:FeS assembly protein IscX
MIVSAEEKNLLYWDATYAIAVELMAQFPGRDPRRIGLHELAEMVTALPEFADDPALATERILLDIQITWFEEVMSR